MKDEMKRGGWWRKERSEEAEKRTRIALANRGQTKTNTRRGTMPEGNLRNGKKTLW